MFFFFFYRKKRAYEFCLCRDFSRVLSRSPNARLAKVFNTVRGQSFEVTADVFNVLHVLSSDWGLIRSTTSFEEVNLLTRTGFDAANQRGIYALSLPQRRKVDTNLSRWRVQLGVKYMF